MGEKRCFYEVLGCSREANADDLRRAYKREALKHHPDRNQGDAEAETRFKEVNEAYQVLADEQKREIYNRFGHEGLAGGGGGAGGADVFSHMQDLFNEMFSGGFGFGGGQQRRGPARGSDLRMQVRITLREAAFGCKKEVSLKAPCRCETCSGSGAAAGSKPETCSQCRGSGQVSAARGFMMFSSPCPRCQGQGSVIKNPCGGCRGRGMVEKQRTVHVNFPAGVDSGQRLRVSGQGMPGPAGAEPGDLYVDIDVEEDERFERDGADLAVRADISYAQAVLGGKVQVPALSADDPDATTTVDIPAGTQPDTVIALRGQGIARLDGRGRGTLAVVVKVAVPHRISDKAKRLLEELEAELSPAPTEKRAAV